MQEARVAASDARSVPTHYKYQTEAVADEALVRVRCPVCGGKTTFKLPWFDTGHERYLALSACPEPRRGAVPDALQAHGKHAPAHAPARLHRPAGAAGEALRRHETALKCPPRRYGKRNA